MKKKLFLFLAIILAILNNSFAQSTSIEIDKIEALKDTLQLLADKSDIELFKLSCESITGIINEKEILDGADTLMLEGLYDLFANIGAEGSVREDSSYLKRQQSLIFGWRSPTDGVLSFSWLKLPQNWDPEESYPMYVSLHGLWSVADNAIEYMCYIYDEFPSTSTSYEDGFLLSPWGRGNHWYEGISEIDIWECIRAFKSKVLVDPYRQFLKGHSMGGYGAMNIGQKTPNYWAALGIHAGALWWNDGIMVTEDVAARLSNTPTYYVCGTADQLFLVNQRSYDLLRNAGNYDIEFVSFNGGHEYRSEDAHNMYLWMKEVEDNFRYVDIDTKNQTTPLFSIFPNPIREDLNIQIELNQKQQVIIKAYNSNGQQIAVIHNSYLSSGLHTIKWDATTLPVGVYFIEAKVGKQTATERFICY